MRSFQLEVSALTDKLGGEGGLTSEATLDTRTEETVDLSLIDKEGAT